LTALEVEPNDRAKLLRHFRSMSKSRRRASTPVTTTATPGTRRGCVRPPPRHQIVGAASIARRLQYSPACRRSALPDFRQIEEALLARSVGDERARQIMQSRDAHDERVLARAVGATAARRIQVLHTGGVCLGALARV